MEHDNPDQSRDSTPEQFWTVFLLALFLGWAGAHRFYAGKTRSAVIQLITCGGCGIWQIMDVIMILAGVFQNEQGMIYRNRQPGLSCAIALVLYGAAVALEWHRYSVMHPARYHFGSHHANVAPADLGSFGPPVTGTNAALQRVMDSYAWNKFGSNAVVSVDGGPDSNGVYQVTVRTRDYTGGVKAETYNATLDPTGTNVATWQ